MERITCSACGNHTYVRGYGCYTCDNDVANNEASCAACNDPNCGLGGCARAYLVDRLRKEGVRT